MLTHSRNRVQDKTNRLCGDYATLASSFGLAPSGGIYMQFERGKSQETPNAPYRAARIKDERWRSAGPGFELGRAGPRLSFRTGWRWERERHRDAYVQTDGLGAA
jgi:hypothetical protein